METARACRLPVTVLLGVREEDGKYTDRDKIMQIAFTKYQNGLCPGCGLHHTLTRGDENVGRVTVQESICHGCEAVESYQQDKSNSDPYPGKKIGPVIDWDWD